MTKIVPEQQFKADEVTTDSAKIREPVDISSVDYVPSSARFRAINVSVAGLITITGFDNRDVQIYVNTGTQPEGGIAIKSGAEGDTATVVAAIIDC